MSNFSTDDSQSPLLPDRKNQGDFFVCDIFDAAPKGDMASMEHPIFSISTRKDMKKRTYRNGDIYVEISPSYEGIATIHDRDVLIFCISQMMAALNEGKKVSRTVRFKAYDLLKATNRMTNGQAYQGLKAAFERLRGTTISTNIVTGNTEQFEVFGIIEKASIVRETREGRMQEVEITLSDWVFNAIQAKEVLTLHPDYFRLRKPLERRIYEIARKHCGRQHSWSISLDKLKDKCGAQSSLKEFRRIFRSIVEQDIKFDHIPDYQIRLDEPTDIVVFTNRGTMTVAETMHVYSVGLQPDTYEAARELAPGWDVFYLEQEWRLWIVEPPQSPDKAFLGFCRKWYERRGKPR